MRVIHWFRQDLRLADNPAFVAACARGEVYPIYILDDENAGDHAMGGASRWWLHHSLMALKDSLGGALSVYRGNAEAIITTLVERLGVDAVYWNRCYEPWRIARDGRIKTALKTRNIAAESYNGSLLWEPWDTLKDDGTPYRVFTPFYQKGCLLREPPRAPIAAPKNMVLHVDAQAITIEALALLPRIRWDAQLAPHWQVSEAGAHAALQCFITQGLAQYKEGRNYPAKPYVSRLSPYLHFGEISPHFVWHSVRALGESPHIAHFCSELGWREFSHNLLYHFPELPRKNLQSKFDGFPWSEDEAALSRWQRGQTGYPIVDAGMRELWQTGYMHNRVRMIVGSFLVKNLLIDWRHGERWFWDCLVDADLANNSASWQWVAGCGADAAPYFRVFNPITQGQKFDAEGEYTRRFVPELTRLPARYLYAPWEAPSSVLQEAGVKLGENYPLPIVDAGDSRHRALEAFASLKTA